MAVQCTVYTVDFRVGGVASFGARKHCTAPPAIMVCIAKALVGKAAVLVRSTSAAAWERYSVYSLQSAHGGVGNEDLGWGKEHAASQRAVKAMPRACSCVHQARLPVCVRCAMEFMRVGVEVKIWFMRARCL